MTEDVTQRTITPAAGKRLIAKALAARPDLRAILESGTLVIIAGTTNGYVAEEVLSHIEQSEGFSRRRFFRGVTLPPSRPTAENGRLRDESDFPGDVVVVNGACGARISASCIWISSAARAEFPTANNSQLVIPRANTIVQPIRKYLRRFIFPSFQDVIIK